MPRRIFHDFEFIEDGVTITPISVGMVDDEGRELYAVSTEFDPQDANEWVRQNVLTQLHDRSDPAWMPLTDMRAAVLEFLAPTTNWEDQPDDEPAVYTRWSA